MAKNVEFHVVEWDEARQFGESIKVVKFDKKSSEQVERMIKKAVNRVLVVK